MTAVYAVSVANEFIRLSHAQSKPCSNMKVQKLVYIAHGLHLAMGKGPLVTETFEAWKYGPVIPSLYHKFKGYFAGPIPVNHPYVAFCEQLAPFDAALVKKTYEMFGSWTALQLSDLSHADGSPWSVAYNSAGDSANVPNDAIEAYFKAHYLKQPTKTQ